MERRHIEGGLPGQGQTSRNGPEGSERVEVAVSAGTLGKVRGRIRWEEGMESYEQ